MGGDDLGQGGREGPRTLHTVRQGADAQQHGCGLPEGQIPRGGDDGVELLQEDLEGLPGMAELQPFSQGHQGCTAASAFSGGT